MKTLSLYKALKNREVDPGDQVLIIGYAAKRITSDLESLRSHGQDELDVSMRKVLVLDPLDLELKKGYICEVL